MQQSTEKIFLSLSGRADSCGNITLSTTLLQYLTKGCYSITKVGLMLTPYIF